MAFSDAAENPLLSSKPFDAPVSVHLHPLVLLTVSDYITRHTLRNFTGPVVGGIFGSQSGRNFTLEHAFECKVDAPKKEAQKDGTHGESGQAADTTGDSSEQNNASAYTLDEDWFQTRVEQYREVHKAPALDLVALFMLGPPSGPMAAHLPILKQAQRLMGNEGLMLLVFQPGVVEKMEGGKLPVALFEPVVEPVGSAGEDGQQEMKFREVRFEVETGDAEMIGVDFVAKGGGNATAVPGGQETGRAKGKEKAKDDKDKEGENATANVLSAEDDELIASLTAKANAIKMLNQRVNLIRSYLASLPESYLTNADSTTPPPEGTNYPLLRNVNSLVSRLPLLSPPSSSTSTSTEDSPTSTLASASQQSQQDVHLTSLLAALTRSVGEAQTLATRFHTVQRERTSKERSAAYAPGGKMMGGDMLGQGPMMQEAGGF